MTRAPSKPQTPDRESGSRDSDEKPARNRSWDPGRKGQGGEGLSDGYGGSGGDGTGPSGPEDKQGG